MRRRTRIWAIAVFLSGAAPAFAGTADSLLVTLQQLPSRDSNYVLQLNKIGEAFQNSGEYARTIAFAGEALHIADSLHWQKGVAASHNLMGVAYNDMGEYQKALEHHLIALTLREKLGDLPSLANSYINTGNVYMHLLKYDEALDYYQRSLALFEKTGNKHGAGIVLGNIGLVYNDRRQYKEAEDYYLRSINLKKEVHDTSGISDSYTNISIMYMDEGLNDKALENSLRALEMCPRQGHALARATVLSNLGDIYFRMNHYDQCIAYEEQAIRLSEELGSKAILAESCRLIYLAWKAKHNSEKALAYFDRYVHLKDSILNEGNVKSINEMHARFETEKKEKEISLLQKNKNIHELDLRKQEEAGYRDTLWLRGMSAGVVFILGSGVMLAFGLRRRAQNNRLLVSRNSEINLQKNLIEEKNHTIMNGLSFAKSIQERILPPAEEMQKNTGEHFVLFLPKDVVSGDFYWVREGFLAVVDCTGHGVPGALMSLHAHGLLQKAGKEKKVATPAQLLNELDAEVKNSSSPQQDAHSEKFGMDMQVVRMDRTRLLLHFAGARNPLYVVRRAELIELKADRVSIGSAVQPFTNHELPLQKGDMVYLFSDGYADQVGGPYRKKYLSGNFKQFLASIAHLPVEEQQQKLFELHQEWKGNFSQTDDVLVIGVRV